MVAVRLSFRTIKPIKRMPHDVITREALKIFKE